MLDIITRKINWPKFISVLVKLLFQTFNANSSLVKHFKNCNYNLVLLYNGFTQSVVTNPFSNLLSKVRNIFPSCEESMPAWIFIGRKYRFQNHNKFLLLCYMPFVTQAATFHLYENKVVGTMTELTSQNKLNKFKFLTAASYSFPTFYLFNA